jgi:DNA-binding CsgD family transcriptional regulator
MSVDLYTFENLLNASSHDLIFNFLDRQCGQLGYHGYFYSPLLSRRGGEQLFKDSKQVVEGDTLLQHNVFTTYPASWIRHYQEAGHVAIDPVIKRIAASNLPVFWNDVSRGKKMHVVFDEARQHGLANGLTVAVSGMQGSRAVLSMATDIAAEKSPRHLSSTAGQALLTVLHVHEAIQRLDASAVASALPQLTPREKECLLWAAQGKTSWEIANILSVSERAITFHMVNATKKLDATNRRQAVVRAISLRLIEP